MADVSKEQLKELFATGETPTGESFSKLIDTVGKQGPQGDTGDEGPQGPKGEPGADGADGQDGADGFGTEEQYNDLVSRIEALETPAE